MAKNGDFLTVTSQGVDTKNGVFSATVTYTHKFLTDRGWVTAGGLVKGDRLLTKYRSVISGTVKDFLAGALCGDTTLYAPNGGRNCGLKFQDSTNHDYVAWKEKMLSPFFSVISSEGKAIVSPSYDLGVFAEQFAGVRHPRGLFENFSWLGFAIWLMDDGYYNRDRYTLSMGRFRDDEETRGYVSECLEKLGLTHNWNSFRAVVFTVEASDKIAANCSQYAPECMSYKFPDDFEVKDYALSNEGVKYISTFVPVWSVEQASSRKYRDRGLYDLRIEGHHNYMAGNMDNGFVVHNTMPGGNAPKFASSFTVRIYGKNEVDKKVNAAIPTYKKTSVILRKWKFPILSTTCEFMMQMIPAYGNPAGYVDDWNTLSTYLKELDYLCKDGAKWLMFGEPYPTLDAAKTHLYANEKLLAEAKAQIIKECLEKGSLKEAPPEDEEGEPF